MAAGRASLIKCQPMSDLLVVGPGAVGGVLAARFAAKGRRVLILDRTVSGEKELIARGLIHVDLRGNRAPVLGIASARAAAKKPCLAVFLCVKSQDTPRALRQCRPWVGPKTAVVALQNGLGHEKLVRAAAGPRSAVIGTAYFAADRPEPGVAAHTGGQNVLLVSGPRNAAAAALAASLLREAGWEVGVKRSEERLLWTKVCFNAAVNGLGALCAEPNGRLATEPALEELLRAVMREAVSVAKASGHPPLYRHMEALVVRACRNAPKQRNSMLQDIEARRRTERPAIFGPLLAAAKRTRTPAPMLETIDAVLAKLERSRPR